MSYLEMEEVYGDFNEYRRDLVDRFDGIVTKFRALEKESRGRNCQSLGDFFHARACDYERLRELVIEDLQADSGNN